MWATSRVLLLLPLLGCGPGAAKECELLDVEFSESSDIGHGGPVRTCSITRTGDRYDVVASQDTPYPHSGKPEGSRKSPKKSPAEVRGFLRRLVSELGLRELPDTKAPIGLHPTFVTLQFRDACGRSRKLEWVFEGYEPTDPQVAPVVKAFREFLKDASS